MLRLDPLCVLPQFTVKTVGLLAVPPGVLTEIFPVTAPTGIVAVIFVSEFTVNSATFPTANVTLVAPVKLTPVIVTVLPTTPLAGETLTMDGVTRNF